MISPQLHEKSTNVLVFYYAPFCEFSAAAAPEVESLAKQLHDNPVASIPIEVMKVNAHDQSPIYTWEKLEGEGYPIFMLHTSDGRRVRYYREKTVDKLRTFLETTVTIESGILSTWHCIQRISKQVGMN